MKTQFWKSSILLVALLIMVTSLSLLWAQDSSTDENDLLMTQEEAEAWVEQFDNIFNGADSVDLADELFAEDFVGHLPLAPELDREGWKDYVKTFYAGASDMTQEVNQIIIGKDRLVLHVTYNGTHDGVLFGVPATGNPLIMEGIGIFQFNEEGLAVENWAVVDMASILVQIGAVPMGE